jgi:hypothetical protein
MNSRKIISVTPVQPGGNQLIKRWRGVPKFPANGRERCQQISAAVSTYVSVERQIPMKAPFSNDSPPCSAISVEFVSFNALGDIGLRNRKHPVTERAEKTAPSFPTRLKQKCPPKTHEASMPPYPCGGDAITILAARVSAKLC